MKISRTAIALTAVAIAAVGLAYENNSLCMSEYVFESEKVSPAFDGFKICHLSDIHNRRFGEENSRLLDIVSGQSPDIIVISGDLVDSRKTDVGAALEIVERLVGIAPVYYVSGNHEEKLPTAIYDYLMENLLVLGVNLLDGRAETIERNGEFISIAGLFDKKDFPMKSAKGLVREDMLNILINHRPQFAAEFASAGFDLAFCGHAHGGQMRIPGIGGLIAPDQLLFPEYSEGMHFFGDKATVISRGLGNSLVPMRINNRPEVVMVRLGSIETKI